MNRYEVVFKIRLSKKLRDSIIEDAQKREKKTSVYVREQLDRTFRFSQTDIKKIEKKINVISDAGKKINMIARKHNTDGITEVDDETFIHLDEIRKNLEDILVIMSQEKNLDYHTHRDEDEAKDSTFAVRMSLERYREIKRLSREQEISMTSIIRSLLINPIEYTSMDFKILIKRLSFENNKIETNVRQIINKYNESVIEAATVGRVNAMLERYIAVFDEYETTIRRRSM